MTIPYLHPLVVHFPIAFLVLGGVAALAWGVRPTAFTRRFALVLLALGSAGAFVARTTGPVLARSVEGDPAVERFLPAHATASTWALWLAVYATILLATAEMGTLRNRRVMAEQWPLRLLAALLALGAAAAVVRAGHLGGLMVWGVGT